ncbi:hypothetical protein [Oribacterium sp. NK2B42]|uniref:hypothetical protein n=1 Tax=Oribacterium sp. NK2B42 TaxID=689781 RepID=UPI00041AA97E|nr:hypothetical protein [Oribacterium sp. NK2B42]
MTPEKINRLLCTAGKNFFILHIEDILESFDRLDTDPNFKAQKIREYYQEQHGFESKDEYGIRVRLNAVLQIVRAEEVKSALEMINTDDVRILPEAAKTVKRLLREDE